MPTKTLTLDRLKRGIVILKSGKCSTFLQYCRLFDSASKLPVVARNEGNTWLFTKPDDFVSRSSLWGHLKGCEKCRLLVNSIQSKGMRLNITSREGEDKKRYLYVRKELKNGEITSMRRYFSA